ncbi:6-pyruvoyl trahydropterin synthase family protein [Zavarzinia aquatilis]|uniref:6-carboxy-5,6,7,8-tetrahydropterin synthase n=1 Tax=Zavarzinia aquatilis TaxID=2211142 RepID=A0A317EG44_9PROT|nr:6-carboxytetrahydropterin synthase [Zavarzinia aquatilis]PWR24373.1 6-carboxytetrahydropterin synthase [Zavarzinia aquatilis]
MDFTITRQIAIDAGHRIASHGSKCRHLHGHRYVIEASCRPVSGELRAAGEQAGMVLDFGFLKDEMMALIDAPCDHGLIADIADRALLDLFTPEGRKGDDWHAALAATVAAGGFATTTDGRLGQKLYVVPFPPTAEGLARHWFHRLAPAVARRSDGLAALTRVTVHETPNCRADYAPL